MSKMHAARALLVAAGLVVALPATAAPFSSLPSCGDEKHGDGDKKDKEKNPSVASTDPSCGGDHDKKDDKKGDDQV